jgi:gamma-glutamylcyclotransferase (GGCT)/AIG2-like uncharacterized protein YtfP
MKYFAYGMNTNKQSMRNRCPQAKSLGSAKLDNYRFEFKGCATITPDFTGVTDGVIWEITKKCERSLDILEGYPHLYYKINVLVWHRGERIPAMTYIMQSELKLSYPNQSYVDMLEEGYSEHNISLDQIDRALMHIDMLEDNLLTNSSKNYII